MKKFVTLFLILAVCVSLCACQKNDTGTNPIETTSAENENLNSENPEEILKKAQNAYAAYLAPFSGERVEDYEGLTSALVVDLDKNDIPEVVFTYYGEHNMYILSYGKTSGLSVVTPILHSSTPAEVYFSEDEAILYYTDSGHNQGTSWIHEGVCLRATPEGFETVGTVSGDEWKYVAEEAWQNYELFEKVDEEYDNIFADGMSDLTGNGQFTSYFEACEYKNPEKYLEEKLSVDLASKKSEYESFKETAVSAIGTEPLSINVADYDRNGSYEAFAFAGKKLDEGDSTYEGKVWFVSDEGNAKSISSNYDYWSTGEILECHFNSYYQINLVSGSSSPSALWKVSGGECEEIEVFNDNGVETFSLRSFNAHSNSIVATVNAFDIIVENINNLENGSGHTHKPYFFYDTPEGIKEYGGLSITEAQLSSLGGSKYIDLIESEGNTVKDIYLRENGIININFYKNDGEGFYSCNHISLRMMNNSISAINEEWIITGEPLELDEISCEGFYAAASVPELATYPENVTTHKEIKATSLNDFKAAYKSVLYDIEKNPQKYYEAGNTEDNSFAIADINGDCVPELLVRFEGTYMAAMKMTIWTYENNEAVVLTECGAYDEFYEGGFIKSEDYHNHSKGETIWPFAIEKYDFNSGKIETIHQIYCRDKGYMDSQDDPFPYSDDADGDGVIYYICDADDEYDDGKPSTKAEYEKIINKYIPEKNKIDAKYSTLIKSNIEIIR